MKMWEDIFKIILAVTIILLFYYYNSKKRTKEKQSNEEQEIILGVAALYIAQDHVVIQKLPAPFRHHHLYRVYKNLLDRKNNQEIKEGFYTNKREFIGREEALDVAIKSNSLLNPTNLNKLYSEDLWNSGYIDMDFNQVNQKDLNVTNQMCVIPKIKLHLMVGKLDTTELENKKD
jgi:hypothetical protein